MSGGTVRCDDDGCGRGALALAPSGGAILAPKHHINNTL